MTEESHLSSSDSERTPTDRDVRDSRFVQEPAPQTTRVATPPPTTLVSPASIAVDEKGNHAAPAPPNSNNVLNSGKSKFHSFSRKLEEIF